jgi:hypothetical protein
VAGGRVRVGKRRARGRCRLAPGRARAAGRCLYRPRAPHPHPRPSPRTSRPSGTFSRERRLLLPKTTFKKTRAPTSA